MSSADPERNGEKRAYVAATVGFEAPSGAFRKDHLNSIVGFLGGEPYPVEELYAPDAPSKETLYEWVGVWAEFDYETGNGENARPLNSDELDDLVDAVSARVETSTAVS